MFEQDQGVVSLQGQSPPSGMGHLLQVPLKMEFYRKHRHPIDVP